MALHPKVWLHCLLDDCSYISEPGYLGIQSREEPRQQTLHNGGSRGSSNEEEGAESGLLLSLTGFGMCLVLAAHALPAMRLVQYAQLTQYQ